MRRPALVLPLTSLLALTTALALLLTTMTLLPSPAPPVAAGAPTLGDAAPAVPAAHVESAPDQFVTPLALTPPVVLPAAPMALAWARLIYPPGAPASVRRCRVRSCSWSKRKRSPRGSTRRAASAGRRSGVPTTMTATAIVSATAASTLATGCCCRVRRRWRSSGAGPAVLLTAGVFPAAIVAARLGELRRARERRRPSLEQRLVAGGDGAAAGWRLGRRPGCGDGHARARPAAAGARRANDAAGG